MVGDAWPDLTHLQPADYLGVVEPSATARWTSASSASSQRRSPTKPTRGSAPRLAREHGARQLLPAKKDSGITLAGRREGQAGGVHRPGSTTGSFMPKSLLAKAGPTDDTDYKRRRRRHGSAVLPPRTERGHRPGLPASCTPPSSRRVSSRRTRSPSSPVRPIPVGISIVVRKDLDNEAAKPSRPSSRPHHRHEKIAKTFGITGEATADPEFSTTLPWLTWPSPSA